MPYTQDEKLLTVTTPLGQDVLLLVEFKGTEEISQLFSFELTMVSENHTISFDTIIGKTITVALGRADGSKRFFNGIVSGFSQGRGGGEQGGDPLFSSYRATMVPWLWVLTTTADSRIFQNKSVPDIVEQIFSEQGFNDYQLRLHGSYDKREYCVQYRETDFNFISRLLEEEGIYYFFEHENNKHTMIIADSPSEHKPCPGQESAACEISAEGTRDHDTIRTLEMVQRICCGKYTLKDYNFEIPHTDLQVEVPSSIPLGPGDREWYDYPGKYAKKSAGDHLAKIRMEQKEGAWGKRFFGSSDCRSFTSGYRFTLKDYVRTDQNGKDLILVAVQHHATEGYGVDAVAVYENNFMCIPHTVAYRPPGLAVKPVVKGAQTAIVVGPAGEEIYTDEHGRVKVQFHWDREGKRNEKSSCWMRVSQLWAGAGWGAMYIPRINQEVIVDFLEGDPDRPIITGRVYHGTNKPPYSLPEHKSRSTIKSDSTKGGGGFNEFRFEDRKGNEEIYLHGQKDWTIAILNDKNQTIGHDETLAVSHNRDKTVGKDQSEKIGENKSIVVGVDHTETIGANMVLTVGSNQTITVGRNKTETVAINTAETIGVAKELTIGAVYQVTVGASMNEAIGASKAEEIGANKAVTVGADSSENVGANKSVTAGSKMSLTSGDDFSISGGKKGIITIADQLVIKCGDASITLKKNGDIAINGKTINVKGSGNIVMKANKILEN